MSVADENERPATIGRIVLETERLVFRELVLANAPFILELLTQPSFLEFIGDRGVYDTATAQNYILDVQSQYRDPGYGNYIVMLKDTQSLVGLSGLIKRDTLPHTDIGFAYLPEYWRNGYAFEGADALLNYARSNLGLGTIVAVTHPTNTASKNLLEKLGMRFRRFVRAKDTDVEVLLYVPNEYRGN